MGGEFIIEYAVGYATYLVRSVVRRSTLKDTTHWRPIPATVYETRASEGKAKTVYTYQFDGSYYAGHETRDFFWTASAEDYVSRFPTGTAVRIRVNPVNPEQIAFRDDDQGS